MLTPVSSSSQPPSHSSSTPGTGSQSRSCPDAPSTDTDLGRSSQPSVSSTILRTPVPTNAYLRNQRAGRQGGATIKSCWLTRLYQQPVAPGPSASPPPLPAPH